MRKTATRRTFLKLSAAAASVGATKLANAFPAGRRVAIVTDEAAPLIKNPAVQWAIGKLREAIASNSLAHGGAGELSVRIAPASSPMATTFFRVPPLNQPETLAILPGNDKLLATGSDVRGVTYAVLEIADRIRGNEDWALDLDIHSPIIETTPNKVRAVSRGFCSEIEDKSWFYDRAFWAAYLDTLATARFNRFAFTLGLAYDFPRGVTGDYLHFPYPYLVEVPGYDQVHVEPALQPGERQRNLETLQFIAAETARRGMEFQLGLWTHAYAWTDSPHSDHHIVGLTPETHATYCRDALAMLLKACPQITGLTMRIHGESGIPEGSYDFWKTLWEAVPAARTPDGKPRVIELDLHAKGLDQRTIEIAQATGMPVKAGAKFWAEHLGLGYHQADIRATEYPREGVTGTFAVSSGARNFTRYGYGDFYQFPQGAAPGKSGAASKGVDLLYRVWPGTQRHLLWADPALASGYGRAANFCGAAGLEIMEPLFFKGREGSGQPGGRDAYADASLSSPPQSKAPSFWSAAPESPYSHAPADQAAKPSDLDTAKFTLTYITWGRYLYNPDTAPEFYHRVLKQTFGPAGPALETALAASSRILPLVTTAWCPSASNHEFWPEMLTHCNILPYTTRPLYTDNPAPHNVSAISPLDPQLFTSIDQHAKDLISGTPNARYNTSEVIAWLEALVATSTKGLEAARAAAAPKGRTPEFRRAEEDILILNGLGTYYANLFRAALFYSMNLHQPKPDAFAQCIAACRHARDAWAAMAKRAQIIYAADISYGSTPFRRGHWADRVAAIDADLALLERTLGQITVTPGSPNSAILGAVRPTPRPSLAIQHTTPDSFHPGSELPLAFFSQPHEFEAILWYRHVNHGERWLSTPMQSSAGTHTAAIPAAYTDSPYPLQYYFELRTATAATLHPPLNPTFSNQPYYAIHKRS